MKFSTVSRHCSPVLIVAACLAPAVRAATPAELLAGYSAKAGVTASAERGQRFFTTNFGRDLGLSCSSCHGAVPTQVGKDEITGKAIQPFAPAFNPTRFTDAVKVEQQFRLNCKDVVGRDCTAAEKADLLAWLLTLKP
jgi:cytochrome c peroxidase